MLAIEQRMDQGKQRRYTTGARAPARLPLTAFEKIKAVNNNKEKRIGEKGQKYIQQLGRRATAVRERGVSGSMHGEV